MGESPASRLRAQPLGSAFQICPNRGLLQQPRGTWNPGPTHSDTLLAPGWVGNFSPTALTLAGKAQSLREREQRPRWPHVPWMKAPGVRCRNGWAKRKGGQLLWGAGYVIPEEAPTGVISGVVSEEPLCCRELACSPGHTGFERESPDQQNPWLCTSQSALGKLPIGQHSS